MGSWRDAVYLSTDDTWSLEDVLLCEAPHTASVGPNQSYDSSLEVTLPVVLPGDYHLLVRANSDIALFEGVNWSNNTTASMAIVTVDLDVPELQLDTPLANQFSRPGETHYYRLVPPANRTIEITLDSDTEVGSIELFAGSHSIPTRDEFDVRGSARLESKQQLVLPWTAGETYYLLVHAASSAATSKPYTLMGTIPGFKIQGISPTSVGNTGPVTITIDAADLTRITRVTLISDDNQILEPVETFFGDQSQIFATFDLAGALPGLYDVRVVSEQPIVDQDPDTGEVFQTILVDGDHTLADGLVLVEGGGPNLTTKLLLPSAVRLGRAFPFHLEVTNDGNADLVSPVLLVQSPTRTAISFSPNVTTDDGTQVQLIVLSDQGHPTSLAPGERVLVPMYGLPTEGGSAQIGVQDLTSPNLPLDWDAIESYYRDHLAEGEWQQKWSSLKSMVGNTWDELHHVMRLAAAEEAIVADVAYLSGETLFSSLLLRAEQGKSDTAGFLRYPTKMLNPNPFPEFFEGLPVRSPGENGGTGESEACGQMEGEGALTTNDECAQFRPIAQGWLDFIEDVWVDKPVLGAILTRGGFWAWTIYDDYINSGYTGSREFGEDSDIVQGSTLAEGFRDSPTTHTVLKRVWEAARNVIVKRMKNGATEKPITAADLPADNWRLFPISDLLKQEAIDTEASPFLADDSLPDEVEFHYFADGLAYGEFSEAWLFNIPLLLAGGVGKTPYEEASMNRPKKAYVPNEIYSRGSDKFGDDIRQIKGGISLRREVDGEGNTIRIVLRSDLRVYIEDTVDFCPGNLTDKFRVRLATVPMAKLEANDEAHDQEFKMEFAAVDKDGKPLFTDEFNCPGHWECKPKKKPPHPPSACPEDVPVLGEAESGSSDGNLPPQRQQCQPCGEGIPVVGSIDPNDIIGPAGVGEERWLQPDVLLPYTIRFENDPKKATAPAQEVFITNQLDPDMDWSTFELLSIGFGSEVIQVPPGRQSYQTSIETTNPDGSPLQLYIEAGLDRDTGIVSWTFRSLDPATGRLPMDPFAGFLPPNDDSHRGEGFLTYTIYPRADLVTGDRIENQAEIVFDLNAPIVTNTEFNTIDDGGPTSSIDQLPEASTTTFTVDWTGADDEGGSGIASYDVYVSDNGEPFEIWLPDTPLTSAEYDGEVDHTYRFYSVATDNVGFREAEPLQHDAETTVAGWHNSAAPCDVNNKDGVSPLDVLTLIHYINSHPGDTSLPTAPAAPPPYYDVNNDQTVSPLDVLTVITFINNQISGEAETADTHVAELAFVNWAE